MNNRLFLSLAAGLIAFASLSAMDVPRVVEAPMSPTIAGVITQAQLLEEKLRDLKSERTDMMLRAAQTLIKETCRLTDERSIKVCKTAKWLYEKIDESDSVADMDLYFRMIPDRFKELTGAAGAQAEAIERIGRLGKGEIIALDRFNAQRENLLKTVEAARAAVKNGVAQGDAHAIKLDTRLSWIETFIRDQNDYAQLEGFLSLVKGELERLRDQPIMKQYYDHLIESKAT